MYDTYTAKTNREGLTDVLTEIGKISNPLFSNFEKVKATSTKHEWSTYTLKTPGDNAAVEGAPFTFGVLPSPARLDNYTQIFKSEFKVTESQQASNPAGIKDEYAFRVKVAMQELLNDVEYALINGVKAAGNTSTARKLGGILSSITTNKSVTTARDLTLKEINEAVQKCFAKGGRPDWIVSSYKQLGNLSALMEAKKMYAPKDKNLGAQVLVYTSPFGQLAVQGDALMPEGSMVVLQKDMWKVAQLRPAKKVDAAKTGDSKDGAIIAELTLEARAEQLNAKITNLN